jgi:hypothetical protein
MWHRALNEMAKTAKESSGMANGNVMWQSNGYGEEKNIGEISEMRYAADCLQLSVKMKKKWPYIQKKLAIEIRPAARPASAPSRPIPVTYQVSAVDSEMKMAMPYGLSTCG